MKNPPFIIIARHRFTKRYELYDVVAAERGSYPEHEYELLVVELPRQFALDIVSHGTVKKVCPDIKAAADFIHTEYPRTGYYASKGEFESKECGSLKVGPYMPDDGDDRK